MPMTLIRRPRSPKVLHEIILDEVRDAYNKLGDEIVYALEDDVFSWNEIPKFTKYVGVDAKRWFIIVRYDKSTKIGEIYGWVDKGTGEKGGGSAYDIYPVVADALVFSVPYSPKTVATGFGPGIVLQDYSVITDEIYTEHVEHKGIEPRNFTQSMQDQYMSRTRIGGFRSVSEAAIKRGARKIGV